MVIHATAGAVSGDAVPFRVSKAGFRLSEGLKKKMDTEGCGISPDIVDKGLGRFCICPWDGTSCRSELGIRPLLDLGGKEVGLCSFSDISMDRISRLGFV